MNVFRALGTTVVLSLLFVAPAGGAENLVSLSISGPENAIKSGESIQIGVSVRNVSSMDIHADYGSDPGDGELDFVVTVLDGQGRSPPHTEYGKAIFRDADAHFYHPFHAKPPLTMHPDDIFKRLIVVSNLFVMTKPGTYAVTAHMAQLPEDRFIRDAGQTSIDSNTIVITVSR